MLDVEPARAVPARGDDLLIVRIVATRTPRCAATRPAQAIGPWSLDRRLIGARRDNVWGANGNDPNLRLKNPRAAKRRFPNPLRSRPMELIILLFSLACLVWMVPILRAGRLIPIAMLVLGVGTVFGPAFFAIDGPIQISLDRMLWFGMVPLALVGWRLGHAACPNGIAMDWLVVALVGWFLCSRALRADQSPGRHRPLVLLHRDAGGNVRDCPFGPGSREDVRWIFGGSILLGLYLAVTAMLEITEMQSLVFPALSPTRNPGSFTAVVAVR